MKKAIVVLLVLSLTLSLLSGTVAAQGSPKRTVSGVWTYQQLDADEIEITGYSGNEEHLVIPEKIDGKYVVSIGDSAFYLHDYLKSVTFPDRVRTIMGRAFYFCSSIETLTFGSMLTSISSDAFALCHVSTLSFPDSLKTIEEDAFRDCTWLTDITFGSGVEVLAENAFFSCYDLKWVRFLGDAPAISVLTFSRPGSDDSIIPIPNLKIYYTEGKAGWTTPIWYGYDTSPWHEHVYTAVVTEPTCTDRGYTTYICSCGHIYFDEYSYVAALGHDYISHEAQEATCTENGWNSYSTCSRCDYTSYTEITAPGHTVVIEEGFAPTCTEAGLTEGRHCTVCNEVLAKQKPVEALGHTIVTEEGFAPTCTEAGLTEGRYCSVCNEVFAKQEPVDALGHNWDDGVVSTEPTIDEKGVMTYTCARCKEVKTQTITIKHPFTDVPADEWYQDAVQFVYENKLFAGISATEFWPEGKMTRGMLLTVLWQLDGTPAPSSSTSFTDVADGKYYTDAVAWAAEKQLVSGVGNNLLDPDGAVTREQVATILFRYAKFKDYNTDKTADLSSFPDGGKVSGWAKEALAWANAENLISGVLADGIAYLSPQGDATRAQVASILMRYVQNIVK